MGWWGDRALVQEEPSQLGSQAGLAGRSREPSSRPPGSSL